MRGSAQQYPMMPSAHPHGYPVVVPPGAVPHPPMMHIPPAAVGLPPNVHPPYAFHPSMYGMPVVRCCVH